MIVRVDNTVAQMTEIREPDTAYRIQVTTSDGTKFDISEDKQTGALTVRTVYGMIIVSPQAANTIHLFEQRT